MRRQTGRRAWQGASAPLHPHPTGTGVCMVDEQRRCYRITIRFLPAEHRLIEAAAAKEELCLSAYARQILAGAKPARSARRPGVEKRLLTLALEGLGGVRS